MKRIIAIFIVLLVAAGPVFSQKRENGRVRTVVIDPGHGGAKPGAQGKRSQEKAIVLSVAKKFGKLLEDNYPDLKVIYTRTTDVDISLAERAHIANRNKADLFISIHANSHPTSAPTGVETFVMGLSESRANLEVAKKENADILLEADYKSNSDYQGFDPNAPETYVMLTMFQNAFIDKSLNFAQAIQNQYKQNLKTIDRGVKQAELYVLYKTTCPSVLTEIGFISNPTEEAFMLSDEGQAKIAVSLFNAFMNYKAAEEGTERLANPVIKLKGWGEEKEEAPKADVKPVVAEAEPQPTVKEAPKAEEKPAVKETPKVEEKPAVKETLKAEEKPAVKETPKTEEKPAVKETPKAEEKPAVKETPKAEEKPAVKETPKAEEKPAVKERPKAEEKPSAKPTPSAQLPAQPSKPSPTSQTSPTSPTSSTSPTSQPSQPKAEQPKAQPQKPVAQQGVDDLSFRVQISTSPRLMKAGDPDLHGIKDFNVAQNGKYYLYTVGDYATEQEARQRCKTIKETTPFKDAFVVAIYRGQRIPLDQARQIGKTK